MEREHILEEIRRLAQHNGGKAPGRDQFSKSTGLSPYAWGKYWARWGDAIIDAGLMPNSLNKRTEDAIIKAALVDACRHFSRLPTWPELRVFLSQNDQYPSIDAIYKRFRQKHALYSWMAKIMEGDASLADINQMLLLEPQPLLRAKAQNGTRGYVYLIRWGENYKIGCTTNLERRIKEVTIQLPEQGELVHQIPSDDPRRDEEYLKNRYKDANVRGEWFKLSQAEVAQIRRVRFL